MQVYTYTEEQHADLADVIKTATVRGLVDSGLLDEDIADNWCAASTIIKIKKGFFRTLSDKWLKKESRKDLSYYKAMTMCHPIASTTDTGE